MDVEEFRSEGFWTSDPRHTASDATQAQNKRINLEALCGLGLPPNRWRPGF